MRGSVTYEKPRDELTDNERACVGWLAFNGISLTVNAEDPGAAANIDLTIDGELWEMKNVTNISSSVGNQLRRVRMKWWKLNLQKPIKAVFSTEGASDSFDDLVQMLSSKKHDDEEFLVVSEAGELSAI